jgi:hypothetical protein
VGEDRLEEDERRVVRPSTRGLVAGQHQGVEPGRRGRQGRRAARDLGDRRATGPPHHRPGPGPIPRLIRRHDQHAKALGQAGGDRLAQRPGRNAEAERTILEILRRPVHGLVVVAGVEAEAEVQHTQGTGPRPGHDDAGTAPAARRQGHDSRGK